MFTITSIVRPKIHGRTVAFLSFIDATVCSAVITDCVFSS